MTAIPHHSSWISPEEYLAGEEMAAVKHEYVAGYVYPLEPSVRGMAGASRIHNRICLLIATTLENHLKEKPCEVFIADMKVQVETDEGACFYYPDVVVACDPKDRHRYYLTNPTCIFEVLSPSTERTDRKEKRLLYVNIPALQEYVLADQDKREITVFRRSGNWAAEVIPVDGVLRLESIQANLTVAQIYAGTGVE